MKFRSRNFMLLLYPDNEEHMLVLEHIKLNYDYAYICHNKDYDEKGEIKKEHIHLFLQTINAKWNTALSEDIKLALNFIQQCKSPNNSLCYLIHYNDDSKFQYDINEVYGTLKTKLVKLLKNDKKDENEKIFELLNYIETSKHIISLVNFSYYCSSIGMWDVFRRASLILIKVLEEHNASYIHSKKGA